MPAKPGKQQPAAVVQDLGQEQQQQALQQQQQEDLELGQALLADSLRQARSENAQLTAQAQALAARLASAQADYADILHFREEQVGAEHERAAQLQQQVERLLGEAAAAAQQLAALKAANEAHAARLDEAGSMLADKERMEALLCEQGALIDARSAEAKAARAQLESREAALAKARGANEELALRCKDATALRVLFGEVWLVAASHVKLEGAVPYDREFNTLTPCGKQLVLLGGLSRMHEAAGRQTAVLDLDRLTWAVPEAAALPHHGLLGHSCCTVGRNKLLAFGGSSSGGGPEQEVGAGLQLLATDTMTWTSPVDADLTAAAAAAVQHAPCARLCHAAVALSDRLLAFGGQGADGRLLGDLWALDVEGLGWSELQPHGAAPSPRKGASLCATGDGRRVFLFGGDDGASCLNDVWSFEVQQCTWSRLQPGDGVRPEPREGHTAGMLNNRFLLISGGCTSGGAPAGPAATGAAAASGSIAPAAEADPAAAAAASGQQGGAAASRRLCSTWLMDVSTGAWELLDDGAACSTPWLKQMSCTSALVHGNRLVQLEPSVYEELRQLRMLTLTLPEEIAVMRTAKRQTDQVQERVRLELLDEALACTSSSVTVGWAPPTKHRDHITRYKVLISSSTGVVRGAREVPPTTTTFTATDLRPATQIVVCVKATYDDGSVCWSDSRAYRTTML